MAEGIFEVLLLVGRPGTSKSEIVKHLQEVPLQERRRRYHVGELLVLDEEPLLQDWLQTDELLSARGRPRLFTDRDGFLLDEALWDVLLDRLGLAYQARLAVEPTLHDRCTVVLQFARGGRGAYRAALTTLGPTLLQRAALLYVQVSAGEALRRNHQRAHADQTPGAPRLALRDDQLLGYYRLDDWATLAAEHPDYLQPTGELVLPYGMFDDEEEATADLAQLETSLARATDGLWARWLQWQQARAEAERQTAPPPPSWSSAFADSSAEAGDGGSGEE